MHTQCRALMGQPEGEEKKKKFKLFIIDDCLDFLEVSYPRCSGEESYKVGQSPE